VFAVVPSELFMGLKFVSVAIGTMRIVASGQPTDFGTESVDGVFVLGYSRTGRGHRAESICRMRVVGFSMQVLQGRSSSYRTSKSRFGSSRGVSLFWAR
jgi:hypothetical protein